MESLRPATLESVLERLGFPDGVAPDRAGLDAVYLAWCRSVPFDNLVKRIDHVAGTTPFRNDEPEGFFALWLEHGTGGTCWPSSRALGALLHTLGFAVTLGSAAMGDELFGRIHTHATLLVTVDAATFWVDTSMLTDTPVELVEAAETTLDHPLRPVRAEPVDDLWRVHWMPGGIDTVMGCLLLDREVGAEHYSERYEWSRTMSRFNTAVFATTNEIDRVITMTSGELHTVDHRGRTSAGTTDDERRAIFVDRFGYSEAIVDALPPDDAPDVPLPADGG